MRSLFLLLTLQSVRLVTQPLEPPLLRYKVSLYLPHLCFQVSQSIAPHPPKTATITTAGRYSACFHGGFCGGFAADVLAIFWRIFRGFCLELQAEFLKPFPNPVKQRT